MSTPQIVTNRYLNTGAVKFAIAIMTHLAYNECAKSTPSTFLFFTSSLSFYEGGFLMLSGVQFHSSDPALNTRFDWARKQALAYVNNQAPIGPVYEAALPGREAFCIRDVAHHATGAHALALDSHNFNMLRRFAMSISESRDYCAFWEIMFNGAPSPVDYTDDKDFWYNLPANFDVMDACLRMFHWTGDFRYFELEEFRNFFRLSADYYIRRWDRDGDGVIERQPGTARRGLASYDESDRQDGYKVAADLLAAQYKGLKGYAQMLRIAGEAALADEYEQKATKLQDWYETAWWSEKEQAYAAVWFGGNRFGFEYMGTTASMPLYYSLIRNPHRQQKQLAYILNHTPDCIEEMSYHAEVFWRYGLDDAGRKAFFAMTDPNLKRKEYPEVSFAALGAVVTGLMGIVPDAAKGTFATNTKMNPGEFAQLNNLPLWGGNISLLQEGRTRSTLKNETARPLLWLPEGNATALSVAAGETKVFENTVKENAR
jgi:hypothetical protein